jgi:hypothetical protein
VQISNFFSLLFFIFYFIYFLFFFVFVGIEDGQRFSLKKDCMGNGCLTRHIDPHGLSISDFYIFSPSGSILSQLKKWEK